MDWRKSISNEELKSIVSEFLEDNYIIPEYHLEDVIGYINKVDNLEEGSLVDLLYDAIDNLGLVDEDGSDYGNDYYD